MKATEDFYSVKAQLIHSETEVEYTIQLHANAAIYSGHFPGNPVAPGVVMVQMIQELVEEILHKKLTFLSASNIKFTGLIVPDKNPLVTVKINVTLGDNFRVKAEVRHEQEKFLSFAGDFALVV